MRVLDSNLDNKTSSYLKFYDQNYDEKLKINENFLNKYKIVSKDKNQHHNSKKVKDLKYNPSNYIENLVNKELQNYTGSNFNSENFNNNGKSMSLPKIKENDLTFLNSSKRIDKDSNFHDIRKKKVMFVDSNNLLKQRNKSVIYSNSKDKSTLMNKNFNNLIMNYDVYKKYINRHYRDETFLSSINSSTLKSKYDEELIRQEELNISNPNQNDLNNITLNNEFKSSINTNSNDVSINHYKNLSYVDVNLLSSLNYNDSSKRLLKFSSIENNWKFNKPVRNIEMNNLFKSQEKNYIHIGKFLPQQNNDEYYLNSFKERLFNSYNVNYLSNNIANKRKDLEHVFLSKLRDNDFNKSMNATNTEDIKSIASDTNHINSIIKIDGESDNLNSNSISIHNNKISENAKKKKKKQNSSNHSNVKELKNGLKDNNNTENYKLKKDNSNDANKDNDKHTHNNFLIKSTKRVLKEVKIKGNNDINNENNAVKLFKPVSHINCGNIKDNISNHIQIIDNEDLIKKFNLLSKICKKLNSNSAFDAPPCNFVEMAKKYKALNICNFINIKKQKHNDSLAIYNKDESLLYKEAVKNIIGYFYNSEDLIDEDKLYRAFLKKIQDRKNDITEEYILAINEKEHFSNEFKEMLTFDENCYSINLFEKYCNLVYYRNNLEDYFNFIFKFNLEDDVFYKNIEEDLIKLKFYRLKYSSEIKLMMKPMYIEFNLSLIFKENDLFNKETNDFYNSKKFIEIKKKIDNLKPIKKIAIPYWISSGLSLLSKEENVGIIHQSINIKLDKNFLSELKTFLNKDFYEDKYYLKNNQKLPEIDFSNFFIIEINLKKLAYLMKFNLYSKLTILNKIFMIEKNKGKFAKNTNNKMDNNSNNIADNNSLNNTNFDLETHTNKSNIKENSKENDIKKIDGKLKINSNNSSNNYNGYNESDLNDKILLIEEEIKDNIKMNIFDSQIFIICLNSVIDEHLNINNEFNEYQITPKVGFNIQMKFPSISIKIEKSEQYLLEYFPSHEFNILFFLNNFNNWYGVVIHHLSVNKYFRECFSYLFSVSENHSFKKFHSFDEDNDNYKSENKNQKILVININNQQDLNHILDEFKLEKKCSYNFFKNECYSCEYNSDLKTKGILLNIGNTIEFNKVTKDYILRGIKSKPLNDRQTSFHMFINGVIENDSNIKINEENINLENAANEQSLNRINNCDINLNLNLKLIVVKLYTVKIIRFFNEKKIHPIRRINLDYNKTCDLHCLEEKISLNNIFKRIFKYSSTKNLNLKNIEHLTKLSGISKINRMYKIMQNYYHHKKRVKKHNAYHKSRNELMSQSESKYNWTFYSTSKKINKEKLNLNVNAKDSDDDNTDSHNFNKTNENHIEVNIKYADDNINLNEKNSNKIIKNNSVNKEENLKKLNKNIIGGNRNLNHNSASNLNLRQIENISKNSDIKQSNANSNYLSLDNLKNDKKEELKIKDIFDIDIDLGFSHKITINKNFLVVDMLKNQEHKNEQGQENLKKSINKNINKENTDIVLNKNNKDNYKKVKINLGKFSKNKKSDNDDELVKKFIEEKLNFKKEKNSESTEVEIIKPHLLYIHKLSDDITEKISIFLNDKFKAQVFYPYDTNNDLHYLELLSLLYPNNNLLSNNANYDSSQTKLNLNTFDNRIPEIKEINNKNNQKLLNEILEIGRKLNNKKDDLNNKKYRMSLKQYRSLNPNNSIYTTNEYKEINSNLNKAEKISEFVSKIYNKVLSNFKTNFVKNLNYNSRKDDNKYLGNNIFEDYILGSNFK